VKVSYRQSAKDDVIRQFRYYLVTMAVPEIAVRFREAVKLTVASLREHPLIGPHYLLRNPQLRNLRSWPVVGFDAVRIYYIPESGKLRVIRILHQKRDVRRILERDRATT
jgi:toxin ParE1/3/4